MQAVFLSLRCLGPFLPSEKKRLPPQSAHLSTFPAKTKLYNGPFQPRMALVSVTTYVYVSHLYNCSVAVKPIRCYTCTGKISETSGKYASRRGDTCMRAFLAFSRGKRFSWFFHIWQLNTHRKTNLEHEYWQLYVLATHAVVTQLVLDIPR